MPDKMRAAMHNGKKSQKTGKTINPHHNDSDRENYPNVKKEWVKLNYYYNCYDGEYTSENQADKMSFNGAELRYYNENFQDALNAQNQRYLDNRQKSRIKPMEHWLQSQRYRIRMYFYS